MKSLFGKAALATTSAALLLAGTAFNAEARIAGTVGTVNAATQTQTFNLVVSSDYITTPDGGTVTIWGYGEVGKPMQYPGPTLKVRAGYHVVVNLTNNLPGANGLTTPMMPVSMIFPGQTGVTATGGSAGLMTQESNGPADTVSYSFTAGQPGTYMYQSGTRPGLQVDMGLVGALLVYPSTENPDFPTKSYDNADASFDREYMFMMTEMDPKIHQLVEFGLINQINNTLTTPTLWFLNGRNGPDTLFPDFASWLTHQPYSALTRMHPGEKVLMRMIGAGREQHPFHPHGNNYTVIARDGRMLKTPASATIDLAFSDYTFDVTPGTTFDAIFTWTGQGLNWDMFGHVAGDGSSCIPDAQGLHSVATDPNYKEPCADHLKPLPVVMPENLSLGFGGFWRGSPFIGALGALPPGEGGLNLNGGVVHIWHSHAEKELTNNDIYPGGILTMLIIEPYGVNIP